MPPEKHPYRENKAHLTSRQQPDGSGHTWSRRLQGPDRPAEYIADSLSLIHILNGKIGEKDCLVRLYPSLQFALESEEFGRFAELTRKRMLEKTGEVPDEEDVDEYE